MLRHLLLLWKVGMGVPILLALYMCIFSRLNENVHFPGMPPQSLGRVDKYNRSFTDVVYTPVSNLTQQIMNKTALAPVMEGRCADDTFSYSVGVIFNDPFSYKLKFYQRYYIPILKEDFFTAYCKRTNTDFSCALEKYWKGGFVPLQAAINAAIIQMTTNHYVMEELMSVTAVNMKTLPFIFKENLQNEMFIFYCLLYFSPLIYFLSLNVTRERKKYKDLMNLMGLQDSAFWLSWGLIYAAFIFVTSIIITVIITSTEIIILTGFTVIFTLFFLYGLSLIALAFLMTVLLKKTILTSLVVFLLTLFWGGVGFSAFYQQLPSPLKWIFSICSPFAFSAGINQIIHLDYTMNGVIFPDASGDSYIMIATFSILTFDALLYLALALYFDKILPYGNESHYSPLFFLNSSPCFQHQRTGSHVAWKDVDPEPAAGDYCEPVAPEFHGREAVRIRNVKKVYKEKTGKVEVLKGLSFDIYEGQITAVLGHSGAGKSALLRILSGSSVPTAGSVTIYNKNLSEMQDLEEIRKITGVCPQFNVQFDTLTVKENLRLFAKIKGIQPKDVEQEVQRVLLELDIQNIQDNLATLLSEGQKRKLTIGIALLGDPQVLLLDEPTAGLDPFSRHRIWNFLRERKADRVILLSTNLMDEADMLADRKVILSKGRLKCAGSSVFLKRRWGLGYHLRDFCTALGTIVQMCPFMRLSCPRGIQTSVSPPVALDLFSDLDEGCSLGVMSYEVSTSTLNEVFTKLEGNSMAEQGTSIHFEQVEMSRDTGRLHEMDPPCPPAPETQKAMSVAGLWRLQFWAMARLRFLQLRRGKKGLLILLFVFGVAVFPLIVESIFYAVLNETADLEFKPELYFLSPGQLPQGPRTSLLIINNTESNIEDFIQSLKHQNILLEVDDFENRNGTEDPSYNGAIIVSGKRKVFWCDTVLLLLCPTKRVLCLQGHMLLRTRLPQGSFFLFLVTCSLSPYIAMNSVSDYKRTKSQLWISGLFPSAYWCGQALVDVSLYSLMLLAMYLIFYLLMFHFLDFGVSLYCFQVVLTLGYAASLVSLMYVVAFIFRKRRKNSGLWSFCFYIVSIYTNSSFSNFQCVPVLIPCMALAPSATLIGFIAFLQEVRNVIKCAVNFECPYFQALLFMFVLRCLEAKCGKKIMQKDPVFRISPQSRDARSNAEEPIGEDEDVQAERIRTATALNTSIEEKPVIIASCLHKEYAGQKKRCFSRRRKKTAVRNVSFCVKKGEILGLLGPNGAGKSSSVRMISGMMAPTAGEVAQMKMSIRFLGYCPQENVLWPSLTTREHLEVFAAVKGLRQADAHMAISRLVDAFRLHEQLDVPVQKLSGGAARKLCFVLSLLGDPPILLLDEPSTGLDPAEQKQLWQTVQRAVRNTARGALLTTHSMAEAEAVSTRVFLLVRRCIGSIQHLKNSLGKDYILELKLKEASQGMSVHTEVLRLFPRAALQERYSSSSAYRLPVQDVQPLSQAFHKLETVKRNFNLEEYSLSQCTLGKVFLELSKEQELGNVDEEVNTTMRWKLLCHSEGP
uniref:ATP binding cassette subfamily A member 6 n=1 Tax=Bos mutus grunniens TaxID=30521 RepID=A0A8B9YHH5_BOSMU